MGRFGVELLLVAVVVVTTLGFLLTYIISVELDHVTPYLPYISDTGGKSPESCLFSLVCNVAVLLELLIIYIRFKQVHTFYIPQVPTLCVPIKIFNYISLFFGCISAFGFQLVANFQNDNVAVVHFLGAVMVFTAGIGYQWIQTYISLRVHRLQPTEYRSPSVCWLVLQCVICLLSPVFYACTITFLVVAQHHRRVHDGDGTFHWRPNDGGFAYHIISTASEWTTSLLMIFFFFTFHPDFKRIKLDISVRQRSEVVTTYRSIVNENTPLSL